MFGQGLVENYPNITPQVCLLLQLAVLIQKLHQQLQEMMIGKVSHHTTMTLTYQEHIHILQFMDTIVRRLHSQDMQAPSLYHKNDIILQAGCLMHHSTTNLFVLAGQPVNWPCFARLNEKLQNFPQNSLIFSLRSYSLSQRCPLKRIQILPTRCRKRRRKRHHKSSKFECFQILPHIQQFGLQIQTFQRDRQTDRHCRLVCSHRPSLPQRAALNTIGS